MDGLERRLKGSVQLRLSVWLSVAIVGVAVVAGLASFLSAFNEAHELQDDTLRQVAALLDQRASRRVATGPGSRPPVSDEEERVIVQYLPAVAGTDPAASSGDTPTLPDTLRDGLQTVTLGAEAYRVFVRTLGSGSRIAVAQQTRVRDEVARDSALRTLMPFALLVPILLLLVADMVRKMFRPIATLSAEIDRRAEHELQPFPTEALPLEVRPFVVAINRLLGRVARAMDAQRRFVADAAHELRTPLTALSLQAERLADAEMSGPARERLLTLRAGIERGRSLLEQLLALARAQSSTGGPASAVSVAQVYRRVLEDLMPLAEARGIDIGVQGDADARVLASELDLITIVGNLVDNAIRYAPPGGRVDLSVEHWPGEVVLAVEDDGPGIPATERGRVLDAFYRVVGTEVSGSGLGLSIVGTLTDRLGGRLELRDARGAPHGLRAVVVLPAAPADEASAR